MLSLLELSLTGGVFILAVVVVRALAMNRLPRQAFLLLWAVALARLLLPFSIPSPTSLYSAAGHLGEGFRRAGIVTAGKGTPRISEELLQNFQKKCGATICKDLKGIENGAPLCPCPECVRNAVLALGEVLGE